MWLLCSREAQLAASKTLVISQLCAAAAPMAVRRREEGHHHRSRQNPYMPGQSGGSGARHDL